MKKKFNKEILFYLVQVILFLICAFNNIFV